MTKTISKAPFASRVAIVSDTHGFLSPDVLAAVQGCDLVIHAGDIGNKGVLDQLHSATQTVHAVYGNNDLPDLWASEEFDIASALPRVVELDLPGGKLVVEHGHVHGFHAPEHEKLRKAHPGAKMIVYGHTHKRVVDQSENPWVVNPGAAGNVRTNGGPSCLVLHASEESWEIEIFKFQSQVQLT